MFSRIEEERLEYIHQGRNEQLQHLELQWEEAFFADPDAQLDLGNTVTLPSSFIGSKAWASEQVANVLALCRAEGKPSFFITITTNARWPEIVSQLSLGQTASDISFIIA